MLGILVNCNYQVLLPLADDNLLRILRNLFSGRLGVAVLKT